MVEEGLEEPFGKRKVLRFRHAFLCYDRWAKEPAVAEIRGGAGEVVTLARATCPGGDRFGLRVDQLTMFLQAALLGSEPVTADR